MNCKFCESSAAVPVKKVQSPYVNWEYTLLGCSVCKNLFFNLNEHTVDIEEIYQGDPIDHSKITIKTFKKSRYWRKEKNRIEALFKKNNNKKISSVLDIGCRTGDFLLHFPESIIREGVELSENSVTIAKQRGLMIHRGFVENITFDKQYDVVTCYALLEHLLDPIIFLNRLQKIVSPSGVLVIMIPTYECFKRWMIDTFSSVRWSPLHLNLFSRSFLDGYLAKNGFKLGDRYWTAGGMFNPFKDIPLASRVFPKCMFLIDSYSFFNRFPIFDHLYSYYVKIHNQ